MWCWQFVAHVRGILNGRRASKCWVSVKPWEELKPERWSRGRAVTRYTFLSNHNIHKRLCGLCLGNIRMGEGLQSIAFTKINWLKVPHSQNKGHTIFYKHCDLTKKYNYRAAIWYGAEEGSHSFSLSSLEIFQEICTKKWKMKSEIVVLGWQMWERWQVPSGYCWCKYTTTIYHIRTAIVYY